MHIKRLRIAVSTYFCDSDEHSRSFRKQCRKVYKKCISNMYENIFKFVRVNYGLSIQMLSDSSNKTRPI